MAEADLDEKALAEVAEKALSGDDGATIKAAGV
jgi:hypothetical protein